MAKSKYAPALFEVIGKKDEKAPGLPLPKWWRKDTSASADRSTQTAEPEAAADPEAKAGEPSETAIAGASGNGTASVASASVASTSAVRSPPVAATTTGKPQAAPVPVRSIAPPTVAAKAKAKAEHEWDDEPPPVARLQDGRVELSLNPVNAAIVGGVLVLTLFLAYELGRGFSPAKQVAQANAQAADLDKVKQKAPDPSVLAPVSGGNTGTDRPGGRAATAGPGSTAGNPAARTRTNPPPAPAQNPPPPAPAASGAVQRVPGLTYVILETFQHEHKAEAEQIRQWLKTKQNIDTTVEAHGEKWRLVSTQGFDYSKEPDKRACGEFVQMVKSWGREYRNEYKSKAHYDMHDPAAYKEK